MNDDADEGEHQSPQEGAYQRLSQHALGFFKVLGSNVVGHLYGETQVDGRAQSAHQPGGAFYQAYRCGGVLAKMSHHRIVDEEHDGGRNLGQDRGYGELHNEFDFLIAGHGPSVADIGKQVLFFLHRNESVRSLISILGVMRS